VNYFFILKKLFVSFKIIQKIEIRGVERALESQLYMCINKNYFFSYEEEYQFLIVKGWTYTLLEINTF